MNQSQNVLRHEPLAVEVTFHLVASLTKKTHGQEAESVILQAESKEENKRFQNAVKGPTIENASPQATVQLPLSAIATQLVAQGYEGQPEQVDEAFSKAMAALGVWKDDQVRCRTLLLDDLRSWKPSASKHPD